MKLELFNKETTNLWKKISSTLPANRLPIELELDKKSLIFFQTGDYYYYIFNFNNYAFDFISPEIEKVLGFKPSEVNTLFFMDHIHPEDRDWFLLFETKAAGFLSQLPVDKLMKYKIRYDFRVRNKTGHYIRVLHQVAVVEHDENGGILRTLGVHTDITHLKQDGKPVLSYIGMEGEPSYSDIDVKNNIDETKEMLTRRERLVLSLLVEGKMSKEIGDILNISKQTVDTHRRNMLFKSKLNSTGELIGKAIKHGWI